MKRKRFTVEQIIRMLREAEVHLSEDKSQNLRASLPREPHHSVSFLDPYLRFSKIESHPVDLSDQVLVAACRPRAICRKTLDHRLAANQARLLMGVLAYKLFDMLRQVYLVSEEIKRSREWLIKRLIEVGANFAYRGRRWYVHVASGFPLARQYPAVLG